MNQPGPMLINFVDATNDANHYTKPPPKYQSCWASLQRDGILVKRVMAREPQTGLEHSQEAGRLICVVWENYSECCASCSPYFWVQHNDVCVLHWKSRNKRAWKCTRVSKNDENPPNVSDRVPDKIPRVQLLLQRRKLLWVLWVEVC